MKPLRPIFSVLFSLLVLISSSSFYVGMHLCGGEVKSVAFSAKAEGCQHQKQVPPCHGKGSSKSCCEDKVLIHEAIGFKKEALTLAFENSAAEPIQLPFIISEVIPSIDTEPLRFFHYDTPLLAVNRTVIHQVFLI